MISTQVENVTFMTSHICLVFFPLQSLLFLELLSQLKMLFQLVDLLEPVAPIDGMSRSSVYSTYEGSLTTPGCNEVKHIEKSNLQLFSFFSHLKYCWQVVEWINFLTPLKISRAQLAQFRLLDDDNNEDIVDNFRPPQPLNKRKVSFWK